MQKGTQAVRLIEFLADFKFLPHTFFRCGRKLLFQRCVFFGQFFIGLDDDPSSVLDDDRIVKLVFQEAGKYSFPALNWSYSKGDTLDSACVILTDGLENLGSDKFNPDKIKPSTLNKLYVAMTRSRGDLYLIKSSTFKKIQKEAFAH